MYDNLIELFLEGKTGEHIIDNFPFPVYATDTKGHLKYFNPAATEFAGRKPDSDRDRWNICQKLYQPDGTPLPHDRCPLAVSLKEKQNIHGTEIIAERPDGSRAWFRSYPSLLYNKKKEVIGALNILIDITREKENEKELRQNREELDDFFENASVGMHITGADGTIKRANQTLLDLLGYSREEFIGSHVARFYPDTEVLKQIVQKLTAGETIRDMELRLRHKDGSFRHVLLNSSPRMENGKFVQTRCITKDITQQKQTEISLKELTARTRQEKRLYEAIISNTPDLVYAFDTNYRFIFANDALLEMWGMNGEEYVGKQLREVGYEKWHAEMHEREIDQVIATRKPVKGEVAFPHSKLGERIYEYIFVPVLNSRDEVEAIAGTTRDVTERLEAVHALRKSEEKYRVLFETMDEAFCIIKMHFDEKKRPVDFSYLETNPAFVKHTGLKGVKGKTARTILPLLEDEVYERYGNIALTGKPVHFEKYVDALGYWFEISAFRTGKPEEHKVAILFKNITERKLEQERCERLLEQVKIEQERLADVFRHAPSAMCIHRGPDHIIERANNYYMKLTGNRDVIGKPVREAFPDVEGQGYFELLDRVYKTGKPYIGENHRVLLSPEGEGEEPKEFFIDFVYQPLTDSDGTVSRILLQAVDLTERNRAQEELKAMNESLEERVEERTKELLSYQKQLRSLASRLSRAEENQRHLLAAELHDNLGQLLALGKIKVDQLKNSNGSASSSRSNYVSDLENLLGEALSYTRTLMTELKPPPSIKTDIRAGIEWLADQLEKRGLSVDIKDDSQPKPLHEDIRTTVLQCVRELLFNVLKHTSQKKAVVNLYRKNGRLEVSVTDRGRGFDHNPAERMPENGRQFGLFNIRERIDLLGGDVEIISGLGTGTTITIRVPLKLKKKKSLHLLQSRNGTGNGTVSANGTASTPATLPEPDEKETIKVLLVDDHQMVRAGLRKIIEDHDDILVIGEADDGEEAVHFTRKYSPDIILMDLNMPRMNGIEATRRIKAEMPRNRIIGLSLHNEERVIKDMRSAGASACLTKSEAYESLITTIRAEASVLREESAVE